MAKRITYSYDENAYDGPFMGYAPDSGNEKLCELSRLVYANVTWAEIEPQEGVYDWDVLLVNKKLQRWKDEGKNLVLRFVCDYPGQSEHMDIPKWLYELTGDGRCYNFEYGIGYCPDYNNGIFIEKHRRVLKALGDFFEEKMSGFLSYVELGSLGHWGEWHTYYPAGVPRMPKTVVRKRYVDAYVEAFPKARLLMRRPFAERPDSFGVFNDMTGAQEDTLAWLSWIENGGDYDSTGEKAAIKAVPEIWKYAPVGGEFTSGIPMSVLLSSALPGTLALIRNSHMTFIGPKVPDIADNPELKEAADEVLKNIGYRYWISSLVIKKKLLKDNADLTVVIRNDGAAPVYFEQRLCLYIETPGETSPERYDPDCELSEIAGGMQKEVTISVPADIFKTKGVRIFAGIEGDGAGEPCICLCMKTDRNKMRYLLFES